MHELGLARAIAHSILSHGWEASSVTISVTGGHGDPEQFDQALLAHLQCEAPELQEGQVSVVHLPSIRICSACASTFEGIQTTACPVCGGAPLPSLEPEQVKLELETGEAGSCA
jgi:hypothetical protein